MTIRPPAVQIAVANHDPHARRSTFDDPTHADPQKADATDDR